MCAIMVFREELCTNQSAFAVSLSFLVMLLFIVYCLQLAGIAGGAGGALFIPVLLVLFNFYVYAIPLSRAGTLSLIRLSIRLSI